jgi:phosphate transport system substrate-binding protein
MKQSNRYAIWTPLFLFLIILVPSSLSQTLHGAGSTFPYPLYSKWFESYRKLHPSVKIHYWPVGSDAGIEDLIEGKVDFAASDTAMSAEQLKMAKAKLGTDILQIPAVLGAVVPIYKVDGVNSELKFTGAALAGIYLGTITMWDDPEIANANPSITLPSEKIVVVHHSDPSDTTYQWTDFLSQVSPAWSAGPGKGLNVTWPVGLGAKGDDGVEDLVVGPVGYYGVADFVSGIRNSIGYVQLHYAIERRLPYGDVLSKSGGFVRATDSSVMAAAASSVPDSFRGSIENEPGEGTYPISSFTWLLIPAKMQDPVKTKAMADFVKWMLTDGQNSDDALHYVKLPAAIIDRAMTEIAKMR